jgi:DNA repair protein RecO (recombination protein O)
VGLYRDTAVVLRTHKLAEADRIVVLFTKEHGKVRAVAKGVRKTKSRIGGRLEPLTHAALLVYEGRGELQTISQADAMEHFRPIRDDLQLLTRGLSLLEVVDQVTHEGQADERLYQMLLGALRTLAAGPSPLLVPAFLLKVLAHEGVGPELDVCVGCGAGEPLVAFDAREGGVLCRSCRRGLPLGADALELVRRILGGGLADVLREPAGPATHEVEVLATVAMEHHLERRLRAVHVLEGD